MNTCKYCIRHKDNYCIMLKQNKDDNDSCKLFEVADVTSTQLKQNKGMKVSYGVVNWNIFTAETARIMLPTFAYETEDNAADKAISYAKALVLKLKETLRQGY